VASRDHIDLLCFQCFSVFLSGHSGVPDAGFQVQDCLALGASMRGVVRRGRARNQDVETLDKRTVGSTVNSVALKFYSSELVQ
jgi:hypothetical protein